MERLARDAAAGKAKGEMGVAYAHEAAEVEALRRENGALAEGRTQLEAAAEQLRAELHAERAVRHPAHAAFASADQSAALRQISQLQL
eukprot:4961595-Prymnesium_polylepis.1